MRIVDPCGCFPTGRHYPGIAHLIQVRVVGLAEEFHPDEAWGEFPVAFVDTETTGTDPRNDRIIEIGIVLGQHGVVRERFSWLIDPGVPIAPEATEIHGIKDEDVRGKPRFGEVAAEVVRALGHALPAAYNASFDRAFLLEELARTDLRFAAAPPAIRTDVTWVDPLVFARELFKGQGESRALGAVAERLGVSLVNAHRATDDAEAALKVLYELSKDPRMPGTYAALIQEQRRLERLQVEAQRFWRKN
jgi:DNA polymerase III subunit epsilon